MKAIEFATQLTPDGKIEVPDEFRHMLPAGREFRAIFLIPETADEEDADWNRMTMEQFFKGYSEEDAVYDEK